MPFQTLDEIGDLLQVLLIRGCSNAVTVAVNRCREVFSPQPLQAPSPESIDQYVFLSSSMVSSAPIFSSMSSMRMKSGEVVGRSANRPSLSQRLNGRGRPLSSPAHRHRKLQRTPYNPLQV